MGIHQTLLAVFPFFIIMIAAEIVLGLRSGKKLYSKDQTIASILIAVGQQAIALAPIGIVTAVSLFAWNNRLFDLSASSWWYWPVLFVGFEFSYYWFHRLSHEVRWLWATHSVHHSTEEMNILAAYRFGWTSWLSMGKLIFVPLSFLGFHPASILMIGGINLIYQSWLHTTLIPKLGMMEGILNTPSAHRVHHAKNAEYLDQNHGGVLMIFDRMFGTYATEKEEVPCEFGLVKPLESANAVKLAFYEWGNILKDLQLSKIRHWPGYLFGPPGWAPDGRGQTSADLRAEFQRQPAPSKNLYEIAGHKTDHPQSPAHE